MLRAVWVLMRRRGIFVNDVGYRDLLLRTLFVCVMLITMACTILLLSGGFV